MIRTTLVGLLVAALAYSALAQNVPPVDASSALPADPFARPALVEGKPLPDLRLPTIDGDTLALSSLRGRKLLLIEFASW